MKHRLSIIAVWLALAAPVLSLESITLMWDRCTDTNVAHYVLHHWEVGSAATNTTKVDANTTTVTVSNLAASHTYGFFVTAMDAQLRESDPSNVLFDTPVGQTNRVTVWVFSTARTVWQTNVCLATNWFTRTNTVLRYTTVKQTNFIPVTVTNYRIITRDLIQFALSTNITTQP